jgi:hypothetical protein
MIGVKPLRSAGCLYQEKKDAPAGTADTQLAGPNTKAEAAGARGRPRDGKAYWV